MRGQLHSGFQKHQVLTLESAKVPIYGERVFPGLNKLRVLEEEIPLGVWWAL